MKQNIFRLDIQQSITSINDITFYEFSFIFSVSISLVIVSIVWRVNPSSMNSNEKGFFEDNSSLAQVVFKIPLFLTSNEKYTFKNCSSLTQNSIGVFVTSTCDDTFNYSISFDANGNVIPIITSKTIIEILIPLFQH